MHSTHTPTSDEPPKPPIDLASLQRLAGETPSAYSAFMVFFDLGRGRTLQAVAAKCGASIDTIKKWSSNFQWKHRIQSFNTGIFQQQAAIEAEVQRKRFAEWSARMEAVRELQWIAALELLDRAHRYLNQIDEKQLEKMTLNHVCRAVVVASELGRMALAGIPQQTGFLCRRTKPCPPMPPPTALPAPAQVTLNPEAPRTIPTTSESMITVLKPCEKNISVTKSAEKCDPPSNSEPLSVNNMLVEKNISGPESAKKCQSLSSSSFCSSPSLPLAERVGERWQSPRPCDSSTIVVSREDWNAKYFLSHKSAEKCRLLPTHRNRECRRIPEPKPLQCCP